MNRARCMRSHCGAIAMLIVAIALPGQALCDPAPSAEYRLGIVEQTQGGARTSSARAPRLALTSKRRLREPAPLARDPRLSESQLLVVAVDATGREIARAAVADPRIIRAEFPDAEGRLSGQVLQLESAGFSVVLPDDPRIEQLEVYQPVWNGQRFDLQPLGVADLRELAQ